MALSLLLLTKKSSSPPARALLGQEELAQAETNTHIGYDMETKTSWDVIYIDMAWCHIHGENDIQHA